MIEFKLSLPGMADNGGSVTECVTDENALIAAIIDKATDKGVWLATEDGANGTILVTDNMLDVVKNINSGCFRLLKESKKFFLQHYAYYEHAYMVQMVMREDNELFYAPE